MVDLVGWDIGGVQVKAARVEMGNGERTPGSPVAKGCDVPAVAVRPFEIWRHREELPGVLRRAARDLGGGEPAAMAVTMTAELSDAFAGKAEGVLFVLQGVSQVYPGVPVYVLDTTGSLVPLPEALSRPLDFAATNWVASARLLAEAETAGVLVDVGSTTTDIVPFREGRVAARGSTDTARLTAGELVYTGVVRTNPNTVVTEVPLGGAFCRLASEQFAVMGDVYLLLGRLSEEDYTTPTPDGRPASPEAAAGRLARLVCGDAETLSREEIEGLARYLAEGQVQQIQRALHQVLSGLEGGYRLPVWTTGAGAFLAREAAGRLGLETRDAGATWGKRAAFALPAAAVACLLLESWSPGEV